MKASELKQTHIDYDDNINRWEYYLRSFLGGTEYRDGKYLTAYVDEDTKEYDKRLNSTPLDNHCRNVVNVYSSFLWRINPTREFGNLKDDQFKESFLEDADLDGRSFNAILKDAENWASVYGHCWLFMDKPESVAGTRQEELDQGIRPYLSLITPESVTDWDYERGESGRWTLKFLRLKENVERLANKTDKITYRTWYRDRVEVHMVEGEDVTLLEELPNPIGVIPAICLYSQRSPKRGIGISDLADVADLQKAIYNELSEIEQIIRISNHPSLAKTDSVDAMAGAGGILHMPDDLDPGLKPYMLQPSGANLDAVRSSIEDKVEAIDRITHMGGVRATQTQSKSGVALQAEFQLLNARLSEKADLLELAEEQIWTLFAKWQGQSWDGQVTYPDTFDLRDHSADLLFLQQAKASGVSSQTFAREIDMQIVRLVVEDDDAMGIIAKELEEGDFATSSKEIFGYHIDGGVVTKNEVRADLGLPSTPDGDTFKESENTIVDSTVQEGSFNTEL